MVEGLEMSKSIWSRCILFIFAHIILVTAAVALSQAST